MALCLAFGLVGVGVFSHPASAQALQPTLVPTTADRDGSVAAFITEASQRFRIPEAWIRAVMRVESAFDPAATSSKGAMGLMQLMPHTYVALRVRYGLGADAYDPHDNILAGAAYLRELYDQFGPAGFLAAYNAGPGRYLDYLMTGRTLPTETRNYVARIAPRIGGTAPALTSPAGLSTTSPESRPTLFAPGVGQKAADGPRRAMPDSGSSLMVVRTPDARLFGALQGPNEP